MAHVTNSSSTKYVSIVGPDGTTEPLYSKTNSPYQPITCGICNESGPEVYWFDSTNHLVHSRCVRTIKTAEYKLLETINSLYINKWDPKRVEAHDVAIRAIKESLGSKTFIAYLNEMGEEATTKLFEEVGSKAVVQFKMQSKL